MKPIRSLLIQCMYTSGITVPVVCLNVYVGYGGALPLVEKRRFEQMNKIVEEEFFINSVMVRGALCVSRCGVSDS